MENGMITGMDERLTFEGNFCEIARCRETRWGKYCPDGACSQRKVWERLKQYEDSGAVEVVRCKDCVYYHKAHVLCPDGTEKDFSEFPHEELAPFEFVSAKYGINVSGKCELEKNCGYEVDKSVYREPNDFCSRGERKGGDNNGQE